jgi:hypothetical protein
VIATATFLILPFILPYNRKTRRLVDTTPSNNDPIRRRIPYQQPHRSSNKKTMKIKAPLLLLWSGLVTKTGAAEAVAAVAAAAGGSHSATTSMTEEPQGPTTTTRLSEDGLGNNKVQNTRSLQTTTTPNYRARYVGRFVDFRDSEYCFSGEITMQIACAGTITLDRTSSPNIVCTDLVASSALETVDVAGDVPTKNGMRCVSTCTDDNCASFYTVSTLLDLIGVENNDFGGAVYYECSGDAMEDVTSRIWFEPTNGSGCNATTSIPDASTSQWHILQSGVACDGSEYSYDPYYFECGRGYVASLQFGLTIPSDVFRCIDFGEGCGGDPGPACTNTFDPIYITTVAQNLPPACLETAPGTTIAAPATAPVPASSSSGVGYTATFRAAWGVLFQDATSDCASENPTVTIVCERGSTIEHKTATTGASTTTTTCTKPSPDTLKCTDSRLGPAANLALATIDYVSVVVWHVCCLCAYAPVHFLTPIAHLISTTTSA